MGYTDARALPERRALRRAASRRRGRGRRRRPAVSVLPRPCAGPTTPPRSTRALGAPADWLVEWKYDGIRAQLVRRAGQLLDLVARRGADDRALSRGRGAGAAPARRHRARRRDRGLAGRRAGAVPAAAAAHRPQDADEEAAGRCAGRASSPTTCSSGRATTCARSRSTRAARGSKRCCAGSRRCRCRRSCRRDDWAGAGRAARAVARARRRRLHAQAPRLALRQRPHQGRRHLVEVEDRPAQRRLRADLRAGRPRPPRQRLHRLHLRGVEPHAGRRRRGRGGGRGDRAARAGPSPARCSWCRSPRRTRA